MDDDERRAITAESHALLARELPKYVAARR